MRKLVIFIWLSIFMQCQTQNIEESTILQLNNKVEKFDVLTFQKRKKNNSYLIKTEDCTVKSFSYKNGFVEYFYPQNLYFNLGKNFHKNGIIKDKGISFNEGSAIGIWYHYNEEGSLIKEEDTDSGYLFKPRDIVKYCEKNNIKLSKGYHERDGYQTSVYKNELDGKKVWLLSYIISLNKQEKEVKITLDGQTGKVIKREEFPYDSY
ncbi:hypothetical protein VUJ46_13780 [Chryseobacterium sp. MYb264]|uniref:hypothetical protein n=1 Tax=Chryseobacterium sp. MYb264 TaxID=2745153 RepID=UPI002E144B6C|nr:hypothetical protein VUJ46_13780 [Chryseobacterium sp. MYb264]